MSDSKRKKKKNSKTRHTCWFRIHHVRRLVRQLNRKVRLDSYASSAYVCFYKRKNKKNDRFAWNYYPRACHAQQAINYTAHRGSLREWKGPRKARSILTRRLRERRLFLHEFSLANPLWDPGFRGSFQFPLKLTDCCFIFRKKIFYFIFWAKFLRSTSCSKKIWWYYKLITSSINYFFKYSKHILLTFLGLSIRF